MWPKFGQADSLRARSKNWHQTCLGHNWGVPLRKGRRRPRHTCCMCMCVCVAVFAAHPESYFSGPCPVRSLFRHASGSAGSMSSQGLRDEAVVSARVVAGGRTPAGGPQPPALQRAPVQRLARHGESVRNSITAPLQSLFRAGAARVPLTCRPHCRSLAAPICPCFTTFARRQPNWPKYNRCFSKCERFGPISIYVGHTWPKSSHF